MSTEQRVKTLIYPWTELSQEAAQEIPLSANLKADLGISSLELVEITMAVETSFDVELPDEEVAKIIHLSDIVDIIEVHKHGEVMANSTMLDDIATKLLTINKEIFHSTGKAPQLAVYMRPETVRSLVEDIISRTSVATRDTELVHESAIMGYPVYEISANSSTDHPPYKIVQSY